MDYDRGFEYIIIDWANGFDLLEDCGYFIPCLAQGCSRTGVELHHFLKEENLCVTVAAQFLLALA